MKKYNAILLLLFFLGKAVFAQISVSPLILHMNERKNTSHFTVYNITNDTLECLLNNNFGYPVSDDSGNVYVKMMDTIPDAEPSAKEWVKLYPKNFFLYPSGSQVVRVLAKPTEKLTAGEYWSRPSITAKKKNNAPAENKNQIGLNTTISNELKIFLALSYRTGNVSTNIDASILNYHCDGNNLILLLSLERIGNAAFLGKIVTRLIDNDSLFYEDAVDVAVYYQLKKRISIPIEKIIKKNFSVEILINSDRNDDGADILRINPVILRKNIVLE